MVGFASSSLVSAFVLKDNANGDEEELELDWMVDVPPELKEKPVEGAWDSEVPNEKDAKGFVVLWVAVVALEDGLSEIPKVELEAKENGVFWDPGPDDAPEEVAILEVGGLFRDGCCVEDVDDEDTGGNANGDVDEE